MVLYIADCGGNYESHLQHHCRQTKRGLKDDDGIRSERGGKRVRVEKESENGGQPTKRDDFWNTQL